ncbi:MULTISPECIES: hypothetical protein [Burkholderia cepacia complex]|uniref:hypothetical protein n=1 Tax=Burkholderia cenocepacia TaxID=95486 RepID=UPI002238CE2A|nr:hypothetical protein [Burkholderia cenocepacia]MCW5156431.1 hypothetical protein [Burkholderia cenocepacia]
MNEITFLPKDKIEIQAERKTARIEILTTTKLKQLAKEKAERENTDLSKILNLALIEYLAN